MTAIMLKITLLSVVLFFAAIFGINDHIVEGQTPDPYEISVLSGIQPDADHPIVRINCGWHEKCVGINPPDGWGIDIRAEAGEAVHAAFRRSSGTTTLFADFYVHSMPTKSAPCRYVRAAIYDSSSADAIAMVRYVHVVGSLSNNQALIPAGSIFSPSYSTTYIGYIASGAEEKMCKDVALWDGSHLHQEVEPKASGSPCIGGIVYCNRNDNDDNTGVTRKGFVSHIPDRDCITSTMWLWKIASQAPTVTATAVPSSICPSKLDVNTVPSDGSGGMVTLDPVDGPYVHKEDVTLTANPKSGYAFLGWSGRPAGLDSTRVMTVRMDQDRSLMAHFELRNSAISPIYDLHLAVGTGGGGTVKGVGRGTLNLVTTPGTPGVYYRGEMVALTATPQDGYLFSGWSASVCDDAQTTCTITMDGHRTVTASFVKSYTLETDARTLNVDGVEVTDGSVGGSVTAGGKYAANAKVTVTAQVNDGYRFVGWTPTEGVNAAQGLPTFLHYEVTMDGDKTVTATFRKAYSLAVAATNGRVTCRESGGTAGNCHGSTGYYIKGTSVTLTATPDNSATHGFSHWTVSTGGGSGVSGAVDTEHTANPLTLTLGADTTVTASFTRRYTLTTRVSPAGGGTIAGGGTYDSGTSVTVTASANAGYRFGSWSGDCTGTGVCTVAMTSDKTVTANFTRNQCTLNVVASPTAGGTVSGGWTGNCGTRLSGSASPKATAATGYRFTGWASSPSGWTGGCSGTGACTPTVGTAAGAPGTYTLTARFTRTGTYRTEPVTHTSYSWSASCNIGTRSGSGSNLLTLAAASLAAQAWINRNCPRGGGTSDTSSTTTYGWSASCRIGTRRGSGSGLASRSAASSAATAWINANCAAGGGTSDTSSTTTYGWSASCRIGTGRGSGSGLASRSAASAAATAWINTNCAAGGGTSSTSSTVRWYAIITCADGRSWTIGPAATLSQIIGDANFALVQCAIRPSGQEDASESPASTATATATPASTATATATPASTATATATPVSTATATATPASTATATATPASTATATATPASTATATATPASTATATATEEPERQHGGFRTYSVTTYNWSASCRSGSRSSSGSGFASVLAAASAAQNWITANCRGGGTHSTNSTTTYGWSASCRSGSGSSSGSGLATRAAASVAATAWVNANCPVGGGTSSTSRSTTYGWTASCHSGSGSGSGSGLATRAAASAAAQAWVDTCPAGGGSFTTGSNTSTTYNWSASCTSGTGSGSGSGLATQAAAATAAQAWIAANCGAQARGADATTTPSATATPSTTPTVTPTPSATPAP